MTIERPWWPCGGPEDEMDKFQASVLISLAAEIDRIDLPRHLDISEESDEHLPPGNQVRRYYSIGKVSSETYRKYCRNLWDRSSPSVKFLYLISGMQPAVNYALDVASKINKLKHGTPEVIRDWQKVYSLMVATSSGISTLRENASVAAILGEVGGVENLKSLFLNADKLREIATEFQDDLINRSPDRMDVEDLLDTVRQYLKSKKPRREIQQMMRNYRPGDPCPSTDCTGKLQMRACCQNCSWEGGLVTIETLRKYVKPDGMPKKKCPQCQEDVGIVYACTKCDDEFSRRMSQDMMREELAKITKPPEVAFTKTFFENEQVSKPGIDCLDAECGGWLRTSFYCGRPGCGYEAWPNVPELKQVMKFFEESLEDSPDERTWCGFLCPECHGPLICYTKCVKCGNGYMDPDNPRSAKIGCIMEDGPNDEEIVRLLKIMEEDETKRFIYGVASAAICLTELLRPPSGWEPTKVEKADGEEEEDQQSEAAGHSD